MQNPLIELSQTIAEIVNTAAPRVAAVSSRRKGFQSGLLIDNHRIVTVDHGVELDGEAEILLPSGEVTAASLLGRDPGSDLALFGLEIPYMDLPPLPLAGGATLGELVIGVSRAPDTGPHASMGILSSLSGAWRTWKGGKMDHFIQVDIPVAPGVSGGVALRADGSILGLMSGGLVRGVNVVIPASNLNDFVTTLDQFGGVSRGYLGVGLQPVPQPAGMIVLNVEPNSPSALAHLMVGDVIVAIGGQHAIDFAAIQEFLEPPHVGKQVPLRVYRAGQELEIVVEIGQRPSARQVA
ncbi:S1C family serine protease [Bryobacter aggregatus]|uniref:S1C family serine protease n=1 Tax=Bryobacter aggregatus TaxID=360054 RepID=UPI0004E14D21|nr:trypsin-like peptidase domain-containing protein [Bryobacter aggregatus]